MSFAVCLNAFAPPADNNGILAWLENCSAEVTRELRRLRPDASAPGFSFFLPADKTEFLLKSAPPALDIRLDGVNAFPFDSFHGSPVKQKVYAPDWQNPERLDYTLNAARLCHLLNPGCEPLTLTSLPLAYAKNSPPARDYINSVIRLAESISKLEDELQRRITVALEPEPDCLLDCKDNSTDFFHRLLDASPESFRHVGLCLDTSHFSVVNESPAECLAHFQRNHVPVYKVQLSAAIGLPAEGDPAVLLPFSDDIYLHQCRLYRGGETRAFPDLPEALNTIKSPGYEWRIHYHIPLSGKGLASPLRAYHGVTSFFLTELERLKIPVEIELYTAPALPFRGGEIASLLAEEIDFLFRLKDQE